MRIDDGRYLQVVRRAVAETLVPNLKSAEASRVASIVLGSLDELLRRQESLTRILHTMIPQGVALGERLRLWLTEQGVPTPTTIGAQLPEATEADHDGVAAVRRYRALLRALEDLMQLMQRTISGTHDPGAKRAALRLMSEAARWENSLEQAQLIPVELPIAPVGTDVLDLERLGAIVGKNIDVEGFRISGVERIPGGMSKHTYQFTLDRGSGNTEELIVRKAADRPLVNIDGFVLRREFDLVKSLYAAQYKLPQPLWWSDAAAGAIDDFYVMRKVAGRTSGSLLSTDSPIPEVVMLQMAEQLAILHSVQLDQFSEYIAQHEDPVLLTETITERIRRYVGIWLETWRVAARQPSPAEIYAFTWLVENVPSNPHRPALVHGDFSPHNIMWQGDQLTAVIDWEGAHFGDPAEDLAYIRPHIKARMDWSQFLAHYAACGGRATRESDFDYYDCLFYVRFCLLGNVMTHRVQQLESQDITLLHVDYEYHRRFLNRTMEAIGALETRENPALV
jgi:aminoglycoside phosphotransferase (APT) family kinase protein